MPPVPWGRTTTLAVRQISSEHEPRVAFVSVMHKKATLTRACQLALRWGNFNRLTAYGESYIKRPSDTGSIPVGSTNKKRTFVYRQMFSFCLSKPQAWHIITTQSCISSRSACRPCISSRASVHFTCGLMIYNAPHWWYAIPCGIDDIHAFGVIETREWERLLNCFVKYDIIPLKGVTLWQEPLVDIFRTTCNRHRVALSKYKSSL